MTATYNPDEAERLVRWASGIVRHVAPCPSDEIAVTMHANLAAMADQLEAAAEMAEQIESLEGRHTCDVRMIADANEERDAARAEADQLRARVAELEGFVRAVPDACLQADKVDRDEFPGLFTDEDGNRLYMDEAKRRILARATT